MKILWITLSLVVILVGGVIAMGAGAQAEGQQQTNLIVGAIGQIFGFPLLVVIIAAFFKKFRNVKTLFKAFSLLGILMIAVTLAGR
jgi:hypothetical protein